MGSLTTCQCSVARCKNAATQEDLLCDMCRNPSWSCIETMGGQLTPVSENGDGLSFGPGHLWVQFTAVTDG